MPQAESDGDAGIAYQPGMPTDYLKLALLCLVILVEGVMIYKAWGRWRKIIFLGASVFLLLLVLIANLYQLAQ